MFGLLSIYSSTRIKLLTSSFFNLVTQYYDYQFIQSNCTVLLHGEFCIMYKREKL